MRCSAKYSHDYIVHEAKKSTRSRVCADLLGRSFFVAKNAEPGRVIVSFVGVLGSGLPAQRDSINMAGSLALVVTELGAVNKKVAI
jgi:hypothetical protein